MNPFNLIPAPYQILAKIITGALLVVALTAAWHKFTGHYVQIGRDEVTAKLQPQIDGLRSLNNVMSSQINEQNASILAAKAASEKKQAAYASVLGKYEKQAIENQKSLDWLKEQLAKPDAKSKGCSDALREWRAQ